MRTIAHPDVTDPTSQELESTAIDYGIETYSEDFVLDMFHILTGGTLTSVEHLDIDNLDYDLNVQSFLCKLSSFNLPGSPLEQAFDILRLLSQDSNDSDNNGDALPIFNNKQNANKASKKIKESVKRINNLSDNEKLLLSDKRLFDLLEILRVSDTLDKLGIIRTDNNLILDSSGEFSETRAIRGFDELNLITPHELINPLNYLSYRIVNNDAHIIERYTKDDKLPFITVICDISGSMNRNNKYLKALGIIYNIIKRVMNEECTLLFSYFEKHCFNWYQLDSTSDIDTIWNEISNTDFDKGYTDVQTCIKEAINKYITSNVTSSNKQLIVINDGEDECTLTLDDLFGFKLHSFILDNSNDNLQKLSIASGGSYRNNI